MMKKLFLSVITVLMIILYVTASAESGTYSPDLDMTMNEFMTKYNAEGSSLDSPMLALKFTTGWTTFEGKNVAWFTADKDTHVSILMLSGDKEKGKSTEAGLDEIQIFGDAKYFPALIAVAKKCAGVFSEDVFGVSLSAYLIADTIAYYYENNLESSGYVSYHTMGTDQQYALQFWHQSGTQYYFSIKKQGN